jgi:hypothetical protein
VDAAESREGTVISRWNFGEMCKMLALLSSPETERCRRPRAIARGQTVTLRGLAGRVSGCGVQQLTHCGAQPLHLCDVADRDIRIADKKDVTFKRRSVEELFDLLHSYLL